ncbi:MAG: ABC transporter permease [Thermomicrobiales bacterium]|nr:ABC transporter permease [Thermomicrobiales bacterium]
MGLWQFIARRLALAVLVVALVSVATFTLTHAVPGDPLAVVIGERQANNPEVRAAFEKRWGLDQPLPMQYVTYLRNLLHGDFGESISKRRPISGELAQRIPATAELTLYAMSFAIIVGVPLGLISALNHDRWPDHIARFIALVGASVPVFWLGLLLLYVFFYQLKWLPGPGRLDVGMKAPPTITGMITFDALVQGQWDVFWAALRRLVLPSIALGSIALGIIARMLRSSLLAALGEDYVRTARAKGLAERRVVVGHALRNAMIPTITVVGLATASLLAGAVLTETIFSWPGLGSFAVSAALKLDYPALLGVTLVVAVVYVTINLLVDIVYGILDPRIRTS